MSKKEIIKKIKAIIEDYGSFGVGEVEADCSPNVQNRGNLVDLAEHFYFDKVTVNVYEDGESDCITDYTMRYEELSPYVLDEILILAEKYKKTQK